MARPNHFGDSAGRWNQISRQLWQELGTKVPYPALAEIRRIRRKRGGRQGNTEQKMEVKILLAIRAGIPWEHAFGRTIEYLTPLSSGGKDELENIRLSDTLGHTDYLHDFNEQHRAAATWNFTDSGTVIGVGPRVAFGKFTLTADGRLLNGVATSSLNGVIAEETFYGTYTVNPDCSGTISIEIFSGDTELLAVSVNILFGDRMQRVNGIFTSVMTPGGVSLPTAIAVEGRRQ